MWMLWKWGLTIFLFVGFANLSGAQVVLVGCTATDQSNPQLSDLVDINPMTGVASNHRTTNLLYLIGIAAQPGTDTLFGLTTLPPSTPSNSLLRIDISTGQTTLVGNTGLTIAEGDLAFNPINGFLYGIQDVGPSVNQRNLFRINTATGNATVVGNMSGTGDFSAMAFDAAGTLFAIDTAGTANSVLYTVNSNNGMIVNSVTMSADLGIGAGMAFDPQTGKCYVVDGGTIGANLFYSLDIVSGSLTIIGSTGVPSGLTGLTFVSVPEPSSALLVSTLLILAVCRKQLDWQSHQRLVRTIKRRRQ